MLRFAALQEHVDSRNRPVDGIPAHSEIMRRKLVHSQPFKNARTCICVYMWDVHHVNKVGPTVCAMCASVYAFVTTCSRSYFCG